MMDGSFSGRGVCNPLPFSLLAGVAFPSLKAIAIALINDFQN